MSLASISSLSARQIMLYASCALIVFTCLSMLLMASQTNLALMLNIHANPVAPDWFWAFFNVFGDAWVVLLLLLISERRPGKISSWAFKSWFLGAFLIQLIKFLMPMPRPASVIELPQLSLIDNPPLVGGSMPSGHAFAAISCALIFLMLMHTRNVNRLYFLPVAVVAMLAAWSRVAVGAHWPADVVAGVGLSFFVVSLAYVWDQKKSWANFLIQPKGQTLLIVIHVLIAIHLITLPSDFLITRFFQFLLALISLIKSIDLLQEKFKFCLFNGKQKT